MIRAIENSYNDDGKNLNASQLEPLYRKIIFSNDDELHEQ